MSLIRKLAGETAIYGISSILGRILNYFILTPFLTRIFLPEEYGVFTDMYAYAALLMVLFTYRMETTFFRFGKEPDTIESAYSTSSISILITTGAFVTILLFFSSEIAVWLKYPDKSYYVQWFALIVGADALAAIPFARLRLINRPIMFAAIRIANILINILLILFFLWLCPRLIERGWDISWWYRDEDRLSYVFISNLVASLATVALLLPSYFKLKLRFDLKLWKQMIRYAAPLVLAGIAGVINQLIGIPLMKYLASENIDANLAMVGIYGAVAKIAVLMTLFTQAFNYAAEPFFFRNSNREDAVQIYSQVGQVFTIVGTLAFLGIMLYIDLIEYIIGSEFREGTGIVPLLLLAYLFLGLFYNFSIWYKLRDRTTMGGYIAVGGVIITLAVNLLLIPRVGYYGPAWAAFACYLFMALAAYWSGQKHYKIDYPIVKMGLYIAIALTGYGLNLLGRQFWGSSTALTLTINTILLVLCCYGFYKADPAAIRDLVVPNRKTP